MKKQTIITQEIIESFWSKVDKTETCWLWTKSKYRHGYGCFCAMGTRHKAHRVSYEIAYGKIKDGLFVCHKCDNPSCVNPDHLFLGTHKDNALDMVNKGRHPSQKKTHCKKGHEFNNQNTWSIKGSRRCKECWLECQRKRRARKREIKNSIKHLNP